RRPRYIKRGNAGLNSKTYKIIGRKELALMKDSALLINTSRGGVLDDEALIEALKSNRLRGAALDAFDPEPIPPDHPFLHLDPELQKKLVLTPHLGGVTKQSQSRMLQMAINNILMVMRGEPPKYIVNLEMVQ
ncbi:MAG: NAD(P)-dependent oxidoreductase, partial [Deltaproteobacteria bacterium]|nr:NAD(P)-dependent oxidoreductase [Deltaproteobacteria bacterium]